MLSLQLLFHLKEDIYSYTGFVLPIDSHGSLNRQGICVHYNTVQPYFQVSVQMH